VFNHDRRLRSRKNAGRWVWRKQRLKWIPIRKWQEVIDIFFDHNPRRGRKMTGR
jgi:hypothetical protein